MKFFLILPLLLMGLLSAHADDGSGFAIYQQNMQQLKNQQESKTVRVCGESHVSFDGLQSADDDEFLYDTSEAYSSIKYRPDGGTVNGYVFECDDAHCTNRTVQSMGPNHVFEGKLVKNAAQYRCSTGIADKWIKLFEACEYRGNHIQENQWYMINNEKAVLSLEDCLQFDINVDRKGIKFNTKCEKINGTLKLRCYAIATKDENPPNKPEKEKLKNPNGLQKCLNERTTAEGKACCYVPKNVAYWNNTNCVCTDNTKIFDIASRSCILKSPAGTPVMLKPNRFICSQDDLTKLYTWREEYSLNNAIVNLIDKILEFCTSDENRAEMEFNKMMAQLHALITQETNKLKLEQESAAQLQLTKQNKSRDKIKETSKKLMSMAEDFDRTVWKTEEGKFNSTRLLSDSVAGVVLGTAGGLITSNVIKKNQVSNGFEDIQCTVGGQVVSGWGDEFRVGIQ